MKVIFKMLADESDVYEFPNNTSQKELNEAAFDWMDKNIAPVYRILEDDEEELCDECDECDGCEAYILITNGIHAICPKEGVYDVCERYEKECEVGWK